MQAHTHTHSPTFTTKPLLHHQCTSVLRRQVGLVSTKLHRHVTSISLASYYHHQKQNQNVPESNSISRRQALLSPFVAVGASILLQSAAAATAAGDDTKSATITPRDRPTVAPEEVVTAGIYDATAIGEPLAVGKDKKSVWEKLMNAKIVYLGEAEQVPVKDDRELELEIVKNLRKRCLESERKISLALDMFPCDLQDQLNQYIDKRLY